MGLEVTFLVVLICVQVALLSGAPRRRREPSYQPQGGLSKWKMPEAFRPFLLQVAPQHRRRFIEQCLQTGALCERSSQAWFDWTHPGRMTSFYQEAAGMRCCSSCTMAPVSHACSRYVKQNRFWQAYECASLGKPHLCPVDGGFGGWSEWTDCGDTCGEDRWRQRKRRCDSPRPVRFGLPCDGKTTETKACPLTCTHGNATMTPARARSLQYITSVNNKYKSVQESCSSSHCVYEDLRNLLPLDTLDRYWSALSCYKHALACPVDGDWSKWTKWSTCSSRCGGGSRYRSRKCAYPPPQHGGAACPGSKFETEDCGDRACVEEGPWGNWEAWTSCDQSCGGGIMSRRRACAADREGGRCSGEHKQTRFCNHQICSVDGYWSDWEPWSRCSSSCNWGLRTRKRTCSNPSPEGSGSHCPGHGSAANHCFLKPCTERDAGLLFTGSGHVSYDPRGHPSKGLVLGLRVMPSSPNGILLQRCDPSCSASRCDTMVTLALLDQRPLLVVKAGRAVLDLASSKRLKLHTWHTLEVFVLSTRVRLVVDNISDSSTLTTGQNTANFDQTMVFGDRCSGKDTGPDADSKKGTNRDTSQLPGFGGFLAALTVNFRSQSLHNGSADWQGSSVPVDRINVTVVHIDPEATVPIFRGHQYTWFQCPERSASLRMHVVLKAATTSGILLYSEGTVSDSFLLVVVEDGLVKACGSLGADHTCVTAGPLKIGKWQHVHTSLKDAILSLEVDRHHPVTSRVPVLRQSVTSSAVSSMTSSRSALYTCGGNKVYLGGVPRRLRSIAMSLSDTDTKHHKGSQAGGGFLGMIHTVRLNRDRHWMEWQPIMEDTEGGPSRDESGTAWVGGVGSTALLNADQFSEVTIEGAKELILLRCPHGHQGAVVTWLQNGRLLRPGGHVQLIKQVAGSQPESIVRLRPAGNETREGVYLCTLMLPDGRRRISHAFMVLIQPGAATTLGRLQITADEEEIALSVVAIVVMMTLLFAMCLTIAVAKYAGYTTFSEVLSGARPRLPFTLDIEKNGKAVRVTDSKGGELNVPPGSSDDPATVLVEQLEASDPMANPSKGSGLSLAGGDSLFNEGVPSRKSLTTGVDTKEKQLIALGDEDTEASEGDFQGAKASDLKPLSSIGSSYDSKQDQLKHRYGGAADTSIRQWRRLSVEATALRREMIRNSGSLAKPPLDMEDDSSRVDQYTKTKPGADGADWTPSNTSLGHAISRQAQMNNNHRLHSVSSIPGNICQHNNEELLKSRSSSLRSRLSLSELPNDHFLDYNLDQKPSGVEQQSTDTAASQKSSSRLLTGFDFPLSTFLHPKVRKAVPERSPVTGQSTNQYPPQNGKSSGSTKSCPSSNGPGPDVKPPIPRRSPIPRSERAQYSWRRDVATLAKLPSEGPPLPPKRRHTTHQGEKFNLEEMLESLSPSATCCTPDPFTRDRPKEIQTLQRRDVGSAIELRNNSHPLPPLRSPATPQDEQFNLQELLKLPDAAATSSASLPFPQDRPERVQYSQSRDVGFLARPPSNGQLQQPSKRSTSTPQGEKFDLEESLKSPRVSATPTARPEMSQQRDGSPAELLIKGRLLSQRRSPTTSQSEKIDLKKLLQSPSVTPTHKVPGPSPRDCSLPKPSPRIEGPPKGHACPPSKPTKEEYVTPHAFKENSAKRTPTAATTPVHLRFKDPCQLELQQRRSVLNTHSPVERSAEKQTQETTPSDTPSQSFTGKPRELHSPDPSPSLAEVSASLSPLMEAVAFGGVQLRDDNRKQDITSPGNSLNVGQGGLDQIGHDSKGQDKAACGDSDDSDIEQTDRGIDDNKADSDIGDYHDVDTDDEESDEEWEDVEDDTDNPAVAEGHENSAPKDVQGQQEDDDDSNEDWEDLDDDSNDEHNENSTPGEDHSGDPIEEAHAGTYDSSPESDVSTDASDNDSSSLKSDNTDTSLEISSSSSSE